jgi:hypothetical protein
LLNDLRVCERLAAPKTGACNGRPARMRYRNFLGVKWSQVQILSARLRKWAVSWVNVACTDRTPVRPD